MFKRSPLFTPICLAFAASVSTSAVATSIDDLAQTVEKQQQQIDALTTALESSSTAISSTTIGGYGEHHYNHVNDGSDQIDAHRYVLFVSHQYSESIEFFSEFEIEHGIASATDAGEVEVEQAYIQWQISDNQALKIGQFLVPIGIINETHEPDTFYGVERNSVEKRIIPATWWEAGVMNSGTFGEGFSYDVGFHSGLETTDANIRSGRQKNSKASAETWALTGRIKYTGIQGLELASTINWQQDLTQGEADKASATLIELHAVYNTGPFTVKALYAGWSIGGDAAETSGADDQSGLYIEPSYRISEKLGVFARYSTFDKSAGEGADSAESQFDLGLNYWLADTVVLKFDLQNQNNDSATEKDGFNVGVGWSF